MSLHVTQSITGHIQAPFGRIPLGRPDHNVHTYVVLPDAAAAADADADEGAEQGSAAAAAAAADDKQQQQQGKWRLAAIGEPGELWLSGQCSL